MGEAKEESIAACNVNSRWEELTTTYRVNLGVVSSLDDLNDTLRTLEEITGYSFTFSSIKEDDGYFSFSSKDSVGLTQFNLPSGKELLIEVTKTCKFDRGSYRANGQPVSKEARWKTFSCKEAFHDKTQERN